MQWKHSITLLFATHSTYSTVTDSPDAKTLGIHLQSPRLLQCIPHGITHSLLQRQKSVHVECGCQADHLDRSRSHQFYVEFKHVTLIFKTLNGLTLRTSPIGDDTGWLHSPHYTWMGIKDQDTDRGLNIRSRPGPLRSVDDYTKVSNDYSTRICLTEPATPNSLTSLLLGAVHKLTSLLFIIIYVLLLLLLLLLFSLRYWT